MYETRNRYLNALPENNRPDDVSVLNVVPTGKTAFNITGNTLHSAFNDPANTGFKYCTLGSGRLNTIRSQLQRMQVVFIDEISMIGSRSLIFLITIATQLAITVGDLLQLKPVFDHWIFENSKDGYTALWLPISANSIFKYLNYQK